MDVLRVQHVRDEVAGVELDANGAVLQDEHRLARHTRVVQLREPHLVHLGSL